MKNFAKISQLIKQDLQLTYEPASVKFSDIPSINISRKTNGSYYADTACTALCRCFKDNKILIMGQEGNKQGIPQQLCEGANYFLKLKKITDREAMDVYVNNEHVFANCVICADFLRQLPKFPKKLALLGKRTVTIFYLCKFPIFLT